MPAPKDFSLLNDIYDWHRHHGPKAIPAPGMDYPDDVLKRFEKAYSSEHIYVPMGYSYDLDGAWEKNESIFIEANAVALVSAAMNGFNRKDMALIAQSHGVSASDLITTFDDVLVNFDRGYHPGIFSATVARECFSALEMVSHDSILDFYDTQEEDVNSLLMLMTAAKSAKLWPKTILTTYARANKGKSEEPERELSTIFHNFTDKIQDESQLPHDQNGPRLDWFLDRSGMLLPAVTTKSLGYFNLWEDLVFAVSQKKCPPVLRKIMEYCLDNPPLALRPGIEHGLRGMTVASSENITDGLGIHVYLQNNLKGTWLEPLVHSDVLKLNLLGSDDKIDVLARLDANYKQNGPLWEDQDHLVERVFMEILSTPAERIGVAHFDAVGYLDRVIGPQDYSPELPREKVLSHLLQGLDHLLSKEILSTEEIDEVREFAVKNCKNAVRLLGADYEFDYQAFRTVPSAGVRVLSEAGLDLKKLPKMTNRDRGRVLENDLGM